MVKRSEPLPASSSMFPVPRFDIFAVATEEEALMLKMLYATVPAVLRVFLLYWSYLVSVPESLTYVAVIAFWYELLEMIFLKEPDEISIRGSLSVPYKILSEIRLSSEVSSSIPE